MALSLEALTYTRKSDGAPITVIADREAASGRSNRSLRARNDSTGREFRVTPEGLARKYVLRR